MFYIVSTNTTTNSKHLEKSGRTYSYNDDGIVDEYFGYKRKGTAENEMKKLKADNKAWCERYGEKANKDKCTYEVIERR